MKNPLQPLFDYLRSSKAELEKVTWPSKQETIRYTAIVIIACLAAALFFGALDFGLTHAVQAIVAKRAPTAQQSNPDAPVVPDVVATDENGNPTNVQVQQVPVTTSGTNSQGIQVTDTPASTSTN